jgi:hypothetical protein
MKRCPECDFLYEDEQRLCDMDGTALVPESHAFPDSESPRHRVRRLYRRVAIALPLIVLVVLGSYVFKQQARVTTTHQSPVVESTPAPANAVEPNPASAASIEKENAVEPSSSGPSRSSSESKPRTEKAKEPNSASTGPDRAVEPKAPAAVPPTKPAAKPLRPQTTPAKKVSAANDKDKDSKIASFLKKTGRLLKKPFKL